MEKIREAKRSILHAYRCKSSDECTCTDLENEIFERHLKSANCPIVFDQYHSTFRQGYLRDIFDACYLPKVPDSIQIESDKARKERFVTKDHPCKNCKNANRTKEEYEDVFVEQVQIRKADEGMTLIYHCMTCGATWRHNG